MTNLLQQKIPIDFQGQRLDKVLAEIFAEYSRSKLKNWLLDGTIKVDNKILSPSTILRGNEEITFNQPTSEVITNFVAQDIKLDIVFADDSLIIVNKQPGLIVHPGAGNHDNTLVNALLHFDKNLQQLPRAGIIHRLDRDTSGLLVIARNLKAHHHLTQQMQLRTIKRHYLALVYGHLIAGNTIHTGFGRDPRNRLKMTVCNSEREAITKYTICKQYTYATLLNVELFTGRTHQIRVHMTHIKHPIIGDKLYRHRFGLGKNVAEIIRTQINNFPRQALHASTLTLTHPVSEELITFDAEIPGDFRELLKIMDTEHELLNS